MVSEMFAMITLVESPLYIELIEHTKDIKKQTVDVFIVHRSGA